MNVSQFDYHLPPELIAQTPLEPRHASRLMVVKRNTGQITHHTFFDIVDLLRPGDILIANNTRVIPARLFGRKQSDGKVEILLLKQIDSLRWEALVGGKRLKPGVVVEIRAGERESRGAEGQVSNLQSPLDCPGQATANPPSPLSPLPSFLSLTILKDLGEARRLVEFNQPINALLDTLGQMPLPPYIHASLKDGERYQTIFSRIDGSTAAPTAGLHFTPEILLALRQKGILLDFVTLHIGLDTFKPVTVEQVEQHVIHREFAQLNPETARRINQAKLAGGRLVAVGTTAVRTVETAALRSAGITGSLKSPSTGGKEKADCPWQPVVAIEEETDLFIYPSFTFRAVDVLLTNFHLPKSTLLILVSAFAGLDLIQQAYQEAIAQKYRFYSFGDAMLIL
jgi:S-adenosylmethionine:tRNA ribosyltransferase-isomerase